MSSENFPAKEIKILSIALGNNKLKPLGAITVPMESNGIHKNLKFYVTDTADTAILGASACETLKLTQCVTVAELDSKVHKLGSLNKSGITEHFKNVFSGLGEYEREYHIEMKDDVIPVVQPARRIPYAKETKLKETLVL